MDNAPRLPEEQTTRLRVQMGAFSAQCVCCESQIFATVADPQALACDECGREVQRAVLVEQLEAAARLTAEVLAEQRRAAAPMAN